MYQPQNRLGIPPVVLNLIILNVIMYIITNLLMPNLGIYLALFYPLPGGYFKPYQLVSYMFVHAGFWHIAMNMFALWMFGAQIENIWGAKKFLLFYLACGLGAAGFNFLIDYIKIQGGDSVDAIAAPMVGASGAVFGVLAAYGMMFPNQMLMLLFPPIPMKAKYFVIGYGLIELYSGFSGGDNIAHFAHIGGLITGLIMLLFWRQRGELYRPL